MASVDPYGDTQHQGGNGRPPPEDDESGILVPLLHGINRQLERVELMAQQAVAEAQIASLERRDLRADIRGIRNGLAIFAVAFVVSILTFGLIYALFR